MMNKASLRTTRGSRRPEGDDLGLSLIWAAGSIYAPRSASAQNGAADSAGQR